MPFYLGAAGSLQQLPPVQRNLEMPLQRKGGTHELLDGSLVRDTVSYRRRYTLNWSWITLDQLSVLEALYLQGGPLVYLDPVRRNQLTANQSMGTDVTDAPDGFIARFQGTATSDTAQFRSGTRSLKWDTVTALGATGRGVYAYNSVSAIDSTWSPVLPSTSYTASIYARASASVSMAAIIDWMTAAGVYISTSTGSAANPGTANFSSRFTVTATSPANAAYAIPALLNQGTTGAAVQVWSDEWQLERAAAATAWVVGTGASRVLFDDLTSTLVHKMGASGTPRFNCQATLLEAV
jgi:hypothetical protein